MYAAFVAVVLLQGINDDEKDLLRHLRDRIFSHHAEA
jgi:hypothetical protein